MINLFIQFLNFGVTHVFDVMNRWVLGYIFLSFRSDSIFRSASLSKLLDSVTRHQQRSSYFVVKKFLYQLFQSLYLLSISYEKSCHFYQRTIVFVHSSVLIIN